MKRKIAILASLFVLVFIVQAIDFVRVRASASGAPSKRITNQPASMSNAVTASRARSAVMPMAGATFTVTTTADNGSNSSPTPGSLREAIVNGNAVCGGTINFNIPGSGVQTITPPASLPDITAPVTIDGYTQPGASPNTLGNGDNAVLLIELNGNGGSGLSITTANCTVRGLVINGFN